MDDKQHSDPAFEIDPEWLAQYELDHGSWDEEIDEGRIEIVRMGEWLAPEPNLEVRLLLGKSDEGHHFAVESSWGGGDSGMPGWSDAYASRKEALEAGETALHKEHYSHSDDDLGYGR